MQFFNIILLKMDKLVRHTWVSEAIQMREEWWKFPSFANVALQIGFIF